ncbi:MAG: hypothetical protein AB7S81_01890 [Bdellovibrionales bacterium]
MTDDFPKNGRDALIPEDEYAFEEPEISAEEWQEPPSQDDGFSDPEVSVDDLDDDSLQEELLDEPAMSGEDEEEVLYEEEPEPTPRRGKGILLGAAAAALLVLGGGGYMMFGGTNEPAIVSNTVAPQPMQPQTKTAPVSADTAKAGQPDQGGITPTTSETDLSLFYQPDGFTSPEAAPSSDSTEQKDKMMASSTEIIMHETSIPAAAPAPVADTETKAEQPTAKPEPETKIETAAPTETGETPLKIAKIEDIPLPIKSPVDKEPIETSPQVAHEKEMPTAITLNEGEEDEPGLTSLREEVKKLKARNESLIKELATAQTQKSIEATSAPRNESKKENDKNKAALKKAEEKVAEQAKQLEKADDQVAAMEEENKALKNDVERLQKELEEARSQVERSKKVVADAKAILEKRVKTSIARAQKAAKTQKKRLEATSLAMAGDRLDQPVPETTVRTLQSPQQVETETGTGTGTGTGTKTGSIVLRAAVPDSIWYATSKTDENLKQASVGDTIPGIGRILTIHQNAEGWEVVGTKGTLK